jgi:hypothetical protein
MPASAQLRQALPVLASGLWDRHWNRRQSVELPADPLH